MFLIGSIFIGYTFSVYVYYTYKYINNTISNFHCKYVKLFLVNRLPCWIYQTGLTAHRFHRPQPKSHIPIRRNLQRNVLARPKTLQFLVLNKHVTISVIAHCIDRILLCTVVQILFLDASCPTYMGDRESVSSEIFQS